MLKVGIYTKGNLTREYMLKVNENFNYLLGKYIEGGFVLENPSYTSISNSVGSEESRKLGMIQRGMKLQNQGAEALVIPHNGLNSFAGAIEDALGIPVIKSSSGITKGAEDLILKKVGLIATKGIMNSDVISGALKTKGIEVILPSEEEQSILEDIIYIGLKESNEQLHSLMSSSVMRIIENLKAAGAEGCAIGCTDLSQLIDQRRIDIPLLDSVEMHTRDIAGLMADSISLEEANILGISPEDIIKRENNPYKIFY